MPDISKIKLPGSSQSYDIKDAAARQAIAGGINYVIAWKGDSTPVVANIPAGVVVTYNSTDYTGTLAASSSTVGAFYLVKSSTQVAVLDIYDEYATISETSGSTTTYFWEKIGDTHVDLSSLGALAYKDTASVSFTGQQTDKCLGSDATFTTSVTPTTTNIKATASGTAVGASSTDKCLGSDATFTTTVTPSTSKLVKSTIYAPTSSANAPNWSFSMGTGNDSETLIISGGNGTFTEGAFATGALDANGGGASVATGITSASTSTNSKDEVTAITGVSVTTQPTVALSTGATAGTGVISVATGITSATTSANNKDEVTAITNVGTGTAS